MSIATVTPDVETRTDFLVVVFDVDVITGGAIYSTTVQATNDGDATSLAIGEASEKYPTVTNWDVWYVRRVQI
jgi:hypothetical protein